MVAFMPEPQTLFTVVAPVASGSPAAAGGLPGGRLAEAGGEHTPHQHLVDALRRNSGPFERGADHVRPEFRAASAESSPWNRPSGVRAAETMTRDPT